MLRRAEEEFIPQSTRAGSFKRWSGGKRLWDTRAGGSHELPVSTEDLER